MKLPKIDLPLRKRIAFFVWRYETEIGVAFIFACMLIIAAIAWRVSPPGFDCACP
jgi:hypothetical protein